MAVQSMLVTGANRGLGLEFVRQFAQHPQSPKWLFAACRNPSQAQELKKLADDHKMVIIKELEVTDVKSIDKLIKSVKADLKDEGLNLLINNAGCLKRLSLDQVNEDNMMEAFRVNALAPLLISQAFIPLLKTAASKSTEEGLCCKKAAIVNISTLMASVGDNTSGRSYDSRTSKAALNMISKNLSIDLKDDGILVAILDPGWVKTDLGGDGAKMEVPESVGKMIAVMNGLNAEQTGCFLNFDGKTIPW